MLRVQLLGEVSAVRDGRPVPLSAHTGDCSRSSRCIPGPHARDALAARFWPDTATARANLRTAVWTLRQALGPDAVHATRESVALGPVVRDLDDPDRDGEPCAGLDDDWADAARAEHRARRLAPARRPRRRRRRPGRRGRVGRLAAAHSPRWTSPRTGY